MPDPVYIAAAVEGTLDDAVARRLIRDAGGLAASTYGLAGKQRLLGQLDGYNQAARFGRWLVLVDLDLSEPCAPPAREAWLPFPANNMCFSIVVREIEAWLMSDRESLASFLSVAASAIPPSPEAIDYPKEVMVEIARHSRRRYIREDMVPRDGSGRATGVAYNSRLSEFVDGPWSSAAAAASSPSLRRTLAHLRRLTGIAS